MMAMRASGLIVLDERQTPQRIALRICELALQLLGGDAVALGHGLQQSQANVGAGERNAEAFSLARSSVEAPLQAQRCNFGRRHRRGCWSLNALRLGVGSLRHWHGWCLCLRFRHLLGGRLEHGKEVVMEGPGTNRHRTISSNAHSD
jgi:hypothetical protein